MGSARHAGQRTAIRRWSNGAGACAAPAAAGAAAPGPAKKERLSWARFIAMRCSSLAYIVSRRVGMRAAKTVLRAVLNADRRAALVISAGSNRRANL